MLRRAQTRAKASGRWIGLWLLGLGLLLGAASPVLACTAYGGVIDGDVLGTPPAGQVVLDSNCTIMNWPASNPLTTNFSFNTPVPGQTEERFLIVFDNTVFTGNMSCNAVMGHKLWFVNGSTSTLSANCQNALIPVEKIDKQSPGPTAAIGVPFTYTLTIPVLYDPELGTVINSSGSLNTLHTATIWDDLSPSAIGVDLTVLGVNAYYAGSGVPVTLVPETNPSAPGGVMTATNLSWEAIPLINAGEQIVVEITVVLNNVPANAPGTVFTNTARWQFGRAVDLDDNGIIEDGTFDADGDGVIEDEFFDPLPGESGISQPMTIAAPELVVTKTSTETALNLAVPATFTINVQNTGGGDAWNATILDRLPDVTGPPATGMCPVTAPVVSARIYQADGVTPVSAPLVAGVDYSLTYSGAPTCELSLTMLSAAAVIGPTERLIITYQAELDPDTDPLADGIALINVAGATQWFSGDGTYPRSTFTRTLTDGTPGVVDHQDSWTITTALSGYYFQKLVENRTSGANPATSAAAGDVLRYRLRLFNIDQVINGITITDTLDPARFDLNTFTMVTNLAAVGATHTFNSATGELTVTGNGAPLNLAPPAELVIDFDITLLANLTNGTAVSNQAHLTTTSAITADSDDPYVNGVAAPGDPADPTVVTILSPGPLAKANPLQATATIGEQFTYRITVPATPVAVPLYDVRILDDLTALAPGGVDLRFVSASVVSGGTWTLSNIGTDTSPIIVDAVTGIDIPANGQAVIDITVELLNTLNNNSGDTFSNSASYTYNRANGNNATQRAGEAGSTPVMTVVEPAVTALAKTVSNVTPLKSPTDPAAVGDILEYVVTVPNSGTATAYDASVVDTLPAGVSLVPGSATALINGVAVAGFVVNPTAQPGGGLAWGSLNGDGSLDIPAGQSLVLTYRVTVGSINGLPLNNSVFVEWTSLQNPQGEERTGAGCPSFTAPDDYCHAPVTTPFPTADPTTLVKSVVSDSWNSGSSTATDQILRVGDTVDYRLDLTLREGQLENVVVTDLLPAGLAFDSVVSINGDTAAPYDPVAPFSHAAITGVPAAGQAGTLTWTLGDITNAVDNNTANDTFVIVYRARVVVNTLAHVPSTALNNTATLAYAIGGTPVVNPARLVSSAQITVQQPVISAITKTGTVNGPPAAGNGTQATPYVVDIVNNTMNFQLQACNTGLAPAYGVVLTDQLAPELNEASLTTPVVTINGAAATAGVDYSYTPPAGPGGTLGFTLITPVNPAQCVTATYSVGFRNNIAPNQTWNNSATVGQYWSLPPAAAREYIAITPVTASSVYMTNAFTPVLPTKTVFAPGAEVTIGQEVTYEITVPGTPVNAALNNVVITDTLDARLDYVGYSQVSGPAVTDNSVAPNLSFSVAQIPAGQQVVIRVTARVLNSAPLTDAGQTINNTVTYTYQGALANQTSAPAAVTLVEPLIDVLKAAANTTDPGNPPEAGDTLTYTLTLTASGGANFSNAYDVSIVDSLGLGLAYVPNSATVAGTPVNPAITGDGLTTPQVLTWNTGLDIPEGTAPVVTYQVQVLPSVGANQILRNDVRVAWTGLDGVNANERTGTGTPAYNDYFDTAFTELTTPPPGALSKQNPLATTTVAIGQPFTYTIAVPDVVATTALHDVRIIDNLPAGVTFVGVTKLSAWGTWTPINSGTATNVVITDSSGQGIDIPVGQRIEIALTVVLTDDAATNFSGRTFSNTASYTYNQVDNNPATELPGAGATTGNLTIVGPDTLTLVKSGPVDMNLNVPGTFTLNVHNAGTGTAWDVTVTDRLPNPTPGGMCDAAPTNFTAQLTLADGVTPVGGPLVAGSDFTVNFTGAPSCTVTITMQSAAAAIPANHRLIITYQALLDADNVNGTVLTNVAGATQWYSADPAPGVTPHIYTRALTNGTVGTLDHEDAHSVNPLIPITGIVYDSLSRQPIAGATVTMLRASTGAPLPAGCFNDLSQQNQLTNAYGYYTFELNFSQSECPPGEDYLIAVTAAPTGYDTSGPSRIIPPTTSAATAPYSVPLCPADAVPATTDRCEAQAAAVVPTGGAPTTYYLHLTLSNGLVPRDSQIFNNHIPVDPMIEAAVTISKRSPLINVTRGQMVPYTITVRNTVGGVLTDMAIVDQLPPGFKYVAGSSRFDGNAVEPVIAGNGRQMRWESVDLAYNVTHTIKLLLAVSSGVGEGEYVNQAWVHSNLTGEDSGIATATVRVMPDPTFDCTDILGKVFDDANLNGIQDAGEKGLSGVRVVSARGLIAKTDTHGRYHITCAAVPNEMRGSNFILKVDDRSLPSGYRLTTENPLVQRVTRGKAIKFNFGATIHRVVRLDMADGVFEPGTTVMRPQWKPRLDLLVEELRKGPAVLRLSYLADVEDASLVKARLKVVEQEMNGRWAALNCCYRLTVETELYWRRGGEPVRKGIGP